MKANECAWSLSRTLHALYDLRLKFHFQQEQQQIVTQIDEPNKENDLELLYPWFTTIYARYHNQIYVYFQRDKLFFSFSSSRIFVLIWIVCCCCCSRRSHRMCTLNTENFRLIRFSCESNFIKALCCRCYQTISRSIEHENDKFMKKMCNLAIHVKCIWHWKCEKSWSYVK